jgi:hypothetical protein
MKHIKKNLQIPTDYQLLLHLSDIQYYNILPRTTAELELSTAGFITLFMKTKRL